jgi:hypothetical protein
VSQATGWFGERLGLVRGMRVAVTAFALTMATMAIVMSLGFNPLPLLAAFLFVGYGCHGLVIPTTAVLALEDHGEIAGTASSMMGTLHFVAAAGRWSCVDLLRWHRRSHGDGDSAVCRRRSVADPGDSRPPPCGCGCN